MCCWVYESAFSGDTDSCERVVARDHPASHMRRPQFLDHGRRSGLELVLENDEPQEVETALGLLAPQPLGLQPS